MRRFYCKKLLKYWAKFNFIVKKKKTGGSTRCKQNSGERRPRSDRSPSHMFVPRSRVRARWLFHKQRVHGSRITRKPASATAIRQGTAKYIGQ